MVDTHTWMGSLPDDTRLDMIMMPGSHDAGMSELHHCAPPLVSEGKTRTQALSVGQQVNSGARYFDIRVDFDYGRLVTYHRTDGWGCNGEDLGSVLSAIDMFLQQFPSETVILKFSHIRDYPGHSPAETKRLINDMLNVYSAWLYTHIGDPNLAELRLGDVRGKAILVFDYPEYIDPATGRFRYRDGAAPGTSLVVFDIYSNTSHYESMKRDQLDKWSRYGGMGRGYLFLLSWTLTADATSPSVQQMAAEANSKLQPVLEEQIRVRCWPKPNIVYIDFSDGRMCDMIIGYNF